MILEPVNQSTMDVITIVTLIVVFGLVIFAIIHDYLVVPNYDLPDRFEAHTFAEKIIAMVDGMRLEVVAFAIEDAEIALASRRISENPLANVILEVVDCLTVGAAYQVTRIVTRELAQRPWRTV